MFKVVETFSGIGSQTKALKKLNFNHQVIAIVEWDIYAILAYDAIHNGKQDLRKYQKFTKTELIEKLIKFNLSSDGKRPLTERSLKVINVQGLRKILAAIERTNNLVNITDVSAGDFKEEIDLLTYSFPCQDLSICGAWHGNQTGIDRKANNRSSMLWEIERLLMEFESIGKKMPRFLLMENVSNILSKTHRDNFSEWENYLEEIGYINRIYTLDSINFGIPQNRKRTFMLSIHFDTNYEKETILEYLKKNNLEEKKSRKLKPLKKFLRLNYDNKLYKEEADKSNPNYTPSRKKIEKDNILLFDGNTIIRNSVNTITTKQDRNPNSGLIRYISGNKDKAPYRNLTPRECFLLMGFDEKDYQALIDNDLTIKNKMKNIPRETLIKMAGNSIVVDVLEAIFSQMIHINNNILNK